MRFCCLIVPDLPLTARLRAEPELGGAPVVVTDGSGARAIVLCASLEARQKAVRPGLTVTQARALCPEIVVRPSSMEVERSADAALRDVALAFSPRVERVMRPDPLHGIVHADIAGLCGLYASEKEIAVAMVGAARRVGLEIRVGIADTRGVARIAAMAGLDPIERGREVAELALLPIEALSFGEFGALPITETLRRWGIRTIGEFALLPTRGTLERLGPIGNHLMELSRGIDRTPLAPLPVTDRFEEAIELEYVMYELEPLAFLLRGLLDRIVQRLSCRGLGASSFDLGLDLDPRGTDERHVAVAAATRDVVSLVRLARLSIEERLPANAVRGLRVTVQAAQLRAEQMSLFGPSMPAVEKLATTMARLSVLVGPDRVGSPVVVDSHDPGAYGLRSFEPPTLEEVPREIPPPSRTIARRMFRPPRVAEVFCDRSMPMYVRAEGLGGRVVQVSGPWRTRCTWWQTEISRDDYDVALSDGGLYRIVHDLQSNEWFVDARYD